MLMFINIFYVIFSPYREVNEQVYYISDLKILEKEAVLEQTLEVHLKIFFQEDK